MKGQNFINDLKHVIGIICILSGLVRNCTVKVIPEKHFITFWKRIWCRYMIRPEDRDMKSGTMDRRRLWYDGIIDYTRYQASMIATYHCCLAPLSFFKHIWTCILCVPEPGWSMCTGRNKDKVCLHEWRYRRGSERTVDLTDRFDQSIRIELHNNGNRENFHFFHWKSVGNV